MNFKQSKERSASVVDAINVSKGDWIDFVVDHEYNMIGREEFEMGVKELSSGWWME